VVFDQFNSIYFNGHLPAYQIHVVIDPNLCCQEFDCPGEVASGIISLTTRRIWLRYTDPSAMEKTLIHERAHAATNGDHDSPWLTEMARLQAAGAPITEGDIYSVLSPMPELKAALYTSCRIHVIDNKIGSHQF
jgi:hypothetical protein